MRPRQLYTEHVQHTRAARQSAGREQSTWGHHRNLRSVAGPFRASQSLLACHRAKQTTMSTDSATKKKRASAAVEAITKGVLIDKGFAAWVPTAVESGLLDPQDYFRVPGTEKTVGLTPPPTSATFDDLTLICEKFADAQKGIQAAVGRGLPAEKDLVPAIMGFTNAMAAARGKVAEAGLLAVEPEPEPEVAPDDAAARAQAIDLPPCDQAKPLSAAAQFQFFMWQNNNARMPDALRPPTEYIEAIIEAIHDGGNDPDLPKLRRLIPDWEDIKSGSGVVSAFAEAMTALLLAMCGRVGIAPLRRFTSDPGTDSIQGIADDKGNPVCVGAKQTDTTSIVAMVRKAQDEASAGPAQVRSLCDNVWTLVADESVRKLQTFGKGFPAMRASTSSFVVPPPKPGSKQQGKGRVRMRSPPRSPPRKTSPPRKQSSARKKKAKKESSSDSDSDDDDDEWPACGGSRTSKLPCYAVMYGRKCDRGKECPFSHRQAVIEQAEKDKAKERFGAPSSSSGSAKKSKKEKDKKDKKETSSSKKKKKKKQESSSDSSSDEE